MKGFRTAAQGSRKERLREVEAELKNNQMAGRISQLMQQQVMQNMQNMSQDLGRAMGLIAELQYKILAVQRVSGLEVSKLTAVADELRLKDFNEASDKEDAEQGFTVGTVVDQHSTIILTSKTEAPDSGIFRSKIKLAECGVPELIQAFMEREVGARALIKLNGVDHEVELLAIRQPPAVEAVAQAEVQVQAEGNAGNA